MKKKFKKRYVLYGLILLLLITYIYARVTNNIEMLYNIVYPFAVIISGTLTVGYIAWLGAVSHWPIILIVVIAIVAYIYVNKK